MRSPSWNDPTLAGGGWVAALVAAMSLSLCGATCENQDYYLPQRLTLSERPPLAPQVVDVLMPYRGLNSLDYSIHNTGMEPASYGLAVAACRQCVADPDCGSQTEIIAEGIACDAERGFCVNPSRDDVCLVPATAGPLTLRADEATNGRFSEADLGLADLLHVEFMCLPSTSDASSDCSGTLDFTILLRQVECLVDGDCGSKELCDTQAGFCTAAMETDTGCRIAGVRPGIPGRTAAPWILLAATLAVLRRRGRSSGSRPQ